MSITTIPTRTSADANSSADINTLMANDLALYASLGSIIPNGVKGNILYNNGSGWATLAPGTSGKYLKTQGTGANPMWDTVLTGYNNYPMGRMAGNIYVPTSVEFEYLIPEAKSITQISAKLGTACTGANTNIAWYKNGSTIGTLAISTSSTTVVTKSLSATIGANGVLSWKPTQVGSTVTGANLLSNAILS